jgi:hypothetical protein
MAATSRATVDSADEVVVEWNEEDAWMVQRLDQKWLAGIQTRGEVLGALRAKRAWLKEDIARQFGAVSPEVAARIDGAESGQPLARTGTNRPRDHGDLVGGQPGTRRGTRAGPAWPE